MKQLDNLTGNTMEHPVNLVVNKTKLGALQAYFNQGWNLSSTSTISKYSQQSGDRFI
jgi:hypothetical protein